MDISVKGTTRSGNADCSLGAIFGAALNASTGYWVAFNEETLASLSEHETEVEALEACRRYLDREMRRANILQYLSRAA